MSSVRRFCFLRRLLGFKPGPGNSSETQVCQRCFLTGFLFDFACARTFCWLRFERYRMMRRLLGATNGAVRDSPEAGCRVRSYTPKYRKLFRFVGSLRAVLQRQKRHVRGARYEVPGARSICHATHHLEASGEEFSGRRIRAALSTPGQEYSGRRARAGRRVRVLWTILDTGSECYRHRARGFFGRRVGVLRTSKVVWAPGQKSLDAD